MKQRIFQAIVLVLVMSMFTSCFKNSYGRYHRRAFYKVDRAHFHHKHRHGGW